MAGRERPEVEKHYAPHKKNLGELIAKHKNTKVTGLPTDMQVLFGFLTLIVDIKYRNRYGATIEEQSPRGYNKEAETNL